MGGQARAPIVAAGLHVVDGLNTLVPRLSDID